MLRGAGSCADPVIKHFTKEHVNYFSKPPPPFTANVLHVLQFYCPSNHQIWTHFWSLKQQNVRRVAPLSWAHWCVFVIQLLNGDGTLDNWCVLIIFVIKSHSYNLKMEQSVCETWRITSRLTDNQQLVFSYSMMNSLKMMNTGILTIECLGQLHRLNTSVTPK